MESQMPYLTSLIQSHMQLGHSESAQEQRITLNKCDQWTSHPADHSETHSVNYSVN